MTYHQSIPGEFLRCKVTDTEFCRWPANVIRGKDGERLRLWIPMGDVHYPNHLAGIGDRPVIDLIDEVMAPIRDAGERPVFLDVGANIGCFSLYAATRFGAKIHAVEPSVITREILWSNLAIAGLEKEAKVYPVAFSDRKGSAWLGGRDHCAHIVDEPTQLAVGMVGADDYFAKHGGKLDGDVRPDLIKIDIEGHELRALVGMFDSVSRWGFPPLVVEVHKGVDANQVRDVLIEMGYREFYRNGVPLKPGEEIRHWPQITATR